MRSTTHGSAVLALMTWAIISTAGSAAATGFTINWELPAKASSFGVALGDVDDDGDVDAYIADFDNQDTLWLNDGTGQLTDSGQTLDSGRGSAPLFALLDNDLYLDLFLARHLSASRVWLNDGTGMLSDSGQAVGLGAEPGRRRGRQPRR